MEATSHSNRPQVVSSKLPVPDVHTVGINALGAVVVDPGRTVCYVPIPKCGTNSLRATFPEWRAEDRKEGFNVPGFALVRNPVDRWFSGIAEATFHHDPDRDYDTMLDTARNTGKMVWDNHTRPQAEFLHDFDVELVKLDNASEYVQERFGRRFRWERFRHWVPAHDLVPQILEYYAADVKLYERAL